MASMTTSVLLSHGAQEAAAFYAEIFGTEITQSVPDGAGGVMLCTLELAGRPVTVINGVGPESAGRSQRVSFQLHVDGQEEFDHYWNALVAGGTPSANGWLIDRYDVWWSIVPIQQMQLFSSATPEQRRRMGEAVAGMQRIDLAELERVLGDDAG